MITLTDLLGNDDAEFMSHPDRNCRTDHDAPAADIQAHADQWFAAEPWGESAAARRVEANARKLCAGCPVRAACAAWALPQTDLHGVWGGLTMQGRAKLRGASACGTYGGYLRHRKADEDACEECKAANAEQSRRKRERRNARAA